VPWLLFDDSRQALATVGNVIITS